MVVVYDSVVIFRIYRKVSCTSGLCSKIDFSYPEQRLSACTVIYIQPSGYRYTKLSGKCEK